MGLLVPGSPRCTASRHPYCFQTLARFQHTHLGSRPSALVPDIRKAGPPSPGGTGLFVCDGSLTRSCRCFGEAGPPSPGGPGPTIRFRPHPTVAMCRWPSPGWRLVRCPLTRRLRFPLAIPSPGVEVGFSEGALTRRLRRFHLRSLTGVEVMCLQTPSPGVFGGSCHALTRRDVEVLRLLWSCDLRFYLKPFRKTVL
jgi:hypothetical protein